MRNSDAKYPTPGERAIPGVIMNPGAGPIADSAVKHALANMPTLLADAGISAAKFERDADLDADGRYGFVVTLGDRTAEIEMPGIPLNEVRYMDDAGQNIFDFPRLFICGSSWVWKYGIGILNDQLLGDLPQDD